MTLSAYQFSLRTVVFGPDSASGWELDYERADQWKPLGVRNTKTADVDLEHASGSYGSPDYTGPLVFTWPLIMQDTPSNLGTAAKTLLETTWTASTSDLTLTANLPGVGDYSVVGRPRDPEVDLRNVQFGHVLALVTFVGLSGAITY